MGRYPSTVATLSRRARDIIETAFEKSCDAGKDCPTVTGRLHDFGFRGCTCGEQSVIGGVAHLLNFTGTDTMSAAYYAQVVLVCSAVLPHFQGSIIWKHAPLVNVVKFPCCCLQNRLLVDSSATNSLIQTLFLAFHKGS